MKIGVLAGTPVDTQMGVDYFLSKGEESFGIPCSKDAPTQNEMQVLHKEELLEISVNNCLKMIEQGAEGICIYCNSLTAAIDIENLKSRVPVCVVTPLDIYKECARNYKRLSVIAANGNSLAGIEKVILTENPNCKVFGAGLLPLVEAIEAEIPAEKIYDDFKLKNLTDSFEAIGCDALILGCTHFPYIEDVVLSGLNVELINPNEAMLSVLRNNK